MDSFVLRYTYLRSLSHYVSWHLFPCAWLTLFTVCSSIVTITAQATATTQLSNYSVCRWGWICHNVWSCRMLSILRLWETTLLSDRVLWGRTACCQINLLQRNRLDSLFVGEQTNAFVEVFVMQKATCTHKWKVSDKRHLSTLNIALKIIPLLSGDTLSSDYLRVPKLRVCISSFTPVQDYLCLSGFLLQSHPRRTSIHFHSAYYPEREWKTSNYRKKSFKAQRSNFLWEMVHFSHFNLSWEIQLSIIALFHEKVATVHPSAFC